MSAKVVQDAANHNPDPLIIDPDGGDTKDKFAAENEWRERQEALNRIAYAGDCYRVPPQAVAAY